MRSYFLIDIGGTFIKYGVADVGGRFIEKGVMRNPAREQNVGVMLSAIIGRIRYYQERGDCELSGIAIATAGIVDTVEGKIVYASDNIPGYTGTELSRIIGGAARLPVAAENDVNCAALGEYWLGAGRIKRGEAKSPSPFFCMTLGTGVGGAVIIDGKVIHGAANFAGEVGLMPMPVGGDGRAGTLEELASTSAMIRRYRRMAGMTDDDMATDGKTIFDNARLLGERAAVDAIDALIKNLARGIAGICCVINPALVVIGGAIAEEADYMRPRLLKELKCLMLPTIFETTRFEFSRLGNDAGMLGALYHFKNVYLC